MKENIIVVGCGIFGLSTAFKFLQAKKNVTLIDPLPILDNLKSSSGDQETFDFPMLMINFILDYLGKLQKSGKK